MNQPRTNAEAIKQKNTTSPNLTWERTPSRSPSRINSEKESETIAAKTVKIKK
jgi:hypothetical protein